MPWAPLPQLPRLRRAPCCSHSSCPPSHTPRAPRASPQAPHQRGTHARVGLEQGWVGGSRDTWEGYTPSQDDPPQCRQDAGFSRGPQRVRATGLQLPRCTQSTLRDWKPRPQAAVQGLQGPARQQASQAPDEQFLPDAGLTGT